MRSMLDMHHGSGLRCFDQFYGSAHRVWMKFGEEAPTLMLKRWNESQVLVARDGLARSLKEGTI